MMFKALSLTEGSGLFDGQIAPHGISYITDRGVMWLVVEYTGSARNDGSTTQTLRDAFGVTGRRIVAI